MSQEGAFESLLAQIETFKGGLPPVHAWQPAVDSEMDLLIDREGRWVHEGGEIERPALVKLLASVLRRETDGRYALVTPHERVFIQVQDAPFLIVDWQYLTDASGVPQLLLHSNLDERLQVSLEAPIWFKAGESAPYVTLRTGLSARFSRAAYYRLVELLEQRGDHWGIESGGHFHSLSQD